MTTSTDAASWELDQALVQTLADRVTKSYGKSARLWQVENAAHDEDWPETRGLDDGQLEELFEEIVEELAGRDNGVRR